MDRKIVKAAQDGGRIWNPDHNGFVPAGGIEVQMTPYWLNLEQRGDVVSTDLPEPKAAPVKTDKPAAVEKPPVKPAAAA